MNSLDTLSNNLNIDAASGSRLKRTLLPWFIWGISTLFVQFQFFLQLSSGVMNDAMMDSFKFGAIGAGLLAASFYYIYVILQTPVGALIDRFGSRRLLSLGCFTCGIGCLLFGIAQFAWQAEVGRILMGLGASVGFVGSLNLIHTWFPKEKFGFMVGFAEMTGILATIFANILLAYVITTYGWRESMLGAGVVGLVLCIVNWLFIQDHPKYRTKPIGESNFAVIWQDVKTVLNDVTAWISGLTCGLLFSIVTVFVALWGIPFLMQDVHVSLITSTKLSSMVFIGAAIGSPFWGWYSAKLQNRRTLLIAGSLVTAILLSLVIFLPITHLQNMALLLFLLGFSCSVYILSFAIADDIAPESAHTTYIGFTNALMVITAPIFQPLIGTVLHLLSHHHMSGGHEVYSLTEYRMALSVLPVAILIAAFLSYLLPETFQKKAQ